MTGGEGYAQRHLQQSDYYDQNRAVKGEWHGRGAELLGLKGEVTSDDFEAVRRALDPLTGEFLRQRHGADRIAGNGKEQSRARTLYDMTFSAPKSVSVMSGVGGDERLAAAHGTAVREALEEKLEELGAIREVHIFDRSQAVAELHREFRAKGHDTLVVAATHEEISHITEAIRRDRKEHGELGVGRSFDRYVPLQWTAAQKQDLSNYQEGLVLQFHRNTKLASRYESLEVIRVGPENLFARRETGEEVSISPKQTSTFSVHERRAIEVAPGDSLMLTANRRGPEFRATNGELVKVRSVDQRAISLEDGRTLPANYHEFAHGYAVTAHRSQGKTVDTVIISADVIKQELFYVAASRGRSEIAVVTSDRELLRESVGVSTTRMSAIELVRKKQSAHGLEKGLELNPAPDGTRHAGSRAGEQHSIPTHGLETEKVGDLGIKQDFGLSLGH